MREGDKEADEPGSPPAITIELVDRAKDQVGFGMVGCELTQPMKVVGNPRPEGILFEDEGQLAEREQGHDDASGIAGDRRIKVISGMNERIGGLTWREVTPAIAQVVKMPIASGVGGTQIAELRVEVVLHREHVLAKVSWQEVQSVLLRHQRSDDGLLIVMDVFHVIPSELSQAELLVWRVFGTPQAQASGPCGARSRARVQDTRGGLDAENGVIA